jgi:uncharacterized protein
VFKQFTKLRSFDFQADLHCFQYGELRLVLDVWTGSIHVVDQVVWDLLEALKAQQGDLNLALAAAMAAQTEKADYSLDDLQEAAAEIADLIREGTLFNRDPWRAKGMGDFEGLGQAGSPGLVKSLCLNVAHDCNLSCAYCFAARGNFGGDCKLMPLDIGKAALDFLVKHSGNRQHLEVDFFGGEPLLNISVVKEIVAYGRQLEAKAGKQIQFTLTTNAVLLDQEIQEYLNQEQISVVLSLDGRPRVHDQMRVFADGSGSYAEVLPPVKAMAQSRQQQNYYVRGTYTRANLDFAEDVLHLADQGFEQISVEPVVAPDSEEYALRPADLPQIFEEYERLARAIVEREKAGQPKFNFFHFDLSLEHGPCLPKRLKGCGAGTEYLAITPEGDIYPCHQFVGRSEYLLGNLRAESEIAWDIAADFRRASIYGKPACASCWARFYCGGGCHANAQSFNGNIYQPYDLGCAIQRKRLEVAVYLQAQRLLQQMLNQKN